MAKMQIWIALTCEKTRWLFGRLCVRIVKSVANSSGANSHLGSAAPELLWGPEVSGDSECFSSSSPENILQRKGDHILKI